VKPELFELVVVCTGNRARSPIAEAFLRRLLADLPVRVHSFGTLELTGAPALPEAVAAAAAVGIDISTHRARALGGEDLSQADLVLGFELSHLAAAVIDGGAPRERVFSLPELVELIESAGSAQETDPIARARQTIAAAHAQRLAESPLAELADPLGQSPKFYRDTVEQVRDLSVRLASGLFGRERIRALTP
jgi:protein-tyrosine phosphatase